MPVESYPVTLNNRRQWASLWDLLRRPWERTEDLAERLGVGRTAVATWAHDGDDPQKDPRPGPWAAFLGAVRETARRHPESAARLAEGLIDSLMDVRCRVIIAREGAGTGNVVAELLDVHGAHGAIHPRVMALLDGATREELDEARRAIRAEIEQLEELEAAVTRTPIAVRVVS